MYHISNLRKVIWEQLNQEMTNIKTIYHKVRDFLQMCPFLLASILTLTWVMYWTDYWYYWVTINLPDVHDNFKSMIPAKLVLYFKLFNSDSTIHTLSLDNDDPWPCFSQCVQDIQIFKFIWFKIKGITIITVLICYSFVTQLTSIISCNIFVLQWFCKCETFFLSWWHVTCLHHDVQAICFRDKNWDILKK